MPLDLSIHEAKSQGRDFFAIAFLITRSLFKYLINELTLKYVRHMHAWLFVELQQHVKHITSKTSHVNDMLDGSIATRELY